jgi:hypothetical protein
MKFVEQTITGLGGNCIAACLASMLDLNLDDVPGFDVAAIAARHGWPPDDVDAQDWAIGEWLRPLGYHVATFGPWCDEDHWASRLDLSGLTLGSAWSVRIPDAAHQVVLLDGDLLWDPHPQRHLGVGPFYSFTVIERAGRRLYPCPAPYEHGL